MIKVNRKLWNSWVGNRSFLYCNLFRKISWDSKHNRVVMDFKICYKMSILVLFPFIFIILLCMFGIKDIRDILSIPISLFNGDSKMTEYVSKEHNSIVYNKLNEVYGILNNKEVD